MFAVLTDIEGTTTSLRFVKDVLFPYSRRHLGRYVRVHRDEPGVGAILEAVRAHEAQRVDRWLDEDAIIATLCRWIDEDRKLAPLKTLQGHVWEEGYRTGAFQGHVYDDAIALLRLWHAAGRRLYVFSSGSVAAQKLLFEHTPQGDLTSLFSGFFDTATGSKREASSYAAIALAIGAPPSTILFLSDTVQELDAARAAGMVTMRLNRDGPSSAAVGHPQACTFDDVHAFLTRLEAGDGDPTSPPKASRATGTVGGS
jgi:enolase-phosphatase E1